MRRIPILLILFFSFLMGTAMAAPLAPKKKKKKKDKTEVTREERLLSVRFADGLREFYTLNYNVAADTFRSISSDFPTHAPSYFMLSKVEIEKKNYEIAQNYLQSAINLDKTNEFYQIEMAQVLDLLGDYESSAKYWEEICKSKYNNENYLHALANAYIELKRFPDVIKTYDKMENVIGKIDELAAVKKELWLYMDDVKGAVGEYDKMIATYPYEVLYYSIAADIYIINNMPAQALPYLEKGAQVNANDGKLNLSWFNYFNAIGQPEKGEEYLLKAICCTELPFEDKMNNLIYYMPKVEASKVENSQVLSALKTLTELHPEHYEGWFFLARVQAKMDDIEGAIANAKKAVEMETTDLDLWEFYIKMLDSENKYQEIIKYKDIIQETFPMVPSLNYQVANALTEMVQWNEAIEMAKGPLPYIYDNSILALYYYLIGDCYFMLEDMDNALKYWKMSKKKGMQDLKLHDKINKYDTTR